MPNYEGFGDSIINPHPFRAGVKNHPEICRTCLAKKDHPAHRKSNIEKTKR